MESAGNDLGLLWRACLTFYRRGSDLGAIYVQRGFDLGVDLPSMLAREQRRGRIEAAIPSASSDSA
jgi:hypothetical protein